MATNMNPLDGSKETRGKKSYTKTGDIGKSRTFEIKNIGEVMAANRLFKRSEIQMYNKFSRYGFINPYDNEQYLREYLFFTRPDLNLLAGKNKLACKAYKTAGENSTRSLEDIPYFVDMLNKQYYTLLSLQSSMTDLKTPFINLLTNTSSSRLDLPEINAESHETTSNIMGYTMSTRGHSLKSGVGFDFNLQFNDTAYLEVYNLAKIYDTYVNMCRVGEHTNKKDYITNGIDPIQFSIYKFLVGQDGETIMYYAKITGVYINNVPRGDMSDPTDFGKISLGFHGFDVDDSNPAILGEFNSLVGKYLNGTKEAMTMLYSHGGVNNDWAWLPYVTRNMDARSKRRAPKGSENTNYDYRLKWIK